MRIDLPQSMDHSEALDRAKSRKHVGRKHLHQKRGRAIERHKLNMARSIQSKKRLWKSYTDKVAAYWRGDADSFPPTPSQAK